MLFHSLDFLLFFPVVVLLYYLLPARMRWLLLLGASYLFFLQWEPAYILLILATTGVTYFAALRIDSADSPATRRRLLWLATGFNLGLLLVFKYFNFFNATARGLVEAAGGVYPIADLSLPAPLGISFYTLMAIGYTLDVYQRRSSAERHPGLFALFIAFFPQLAAGPIERGRNMLPQFRAGRNFEYERVIRGLVRMAWGFFKKLVVADRLALLVNTVYADPTLYSGNPLLLATYAFSIQIYCDFSAYSDIAIGAARIVGIDIMENFKQPYFSRSVSDFWRNWHISLSTWLRDYLFFPLRRAMLRSGGAASCGDAALVVPPLVTMLASGLWHGAAWTFVAWGALHGIMILVETAWSQATKAWARPVKLPGTLATGLQMALTFNVISLSWVLFRANSLADAGYILRNLFVNLSFSSTGIAWLMPGGKYQLFIAVCGVLLVLLVDLLQAHRVDLRALALRQPIWLRWAAYYALVLLILMFGKFGVAEFFYVQF